MNKNFKKSKRIPLLSQEELNELGAVLHTKDKELEKKFWKKIYEKRGIIYIYSKDLVHEFDELVSTGKLHLSFMDGNTIQDLSDDDKIDIMRTLKEIEIQEDEEYS